LPTEECIVESSFPSSPRETRSPPCPTCLAQNRRLGKKVQPVASGEDVWLCPVCGTEYTWDAPAETQLAAQVAQAARESSETTKLLYRLPPDFFQG
jgi:hypothetical protein